MSQSVTANNALDPARALEAFTGPNWRYYLTRFEKYQKNPDRLHPSWNWSALGGQLGWLLYHRLYAPALLWCLGAAALIRIAVLVVRPQGWLEIAWTVAYMALPYMALWGFLANQLLFSAFKKASAAAPAEPQARLEALRRAGGENLAFSPRMLVSFLMGFSCGLPLLLTITLLQAWMTEAGVDLATIGLMALVGLPYTLKFVWAPILDRFIPPFLGRRRGWLLMIQLALMAAIAGLGFSNPAANPWLLAGMAFLVTFFSASQDIVVDAYRREDLSDQELGLGSSLYVNGYRVGMLLASGGGLMLADMVSYRTVYLIMAACLLLGVITTLLCREPVAEKGAPQSFKESVLGPFVEYFSRAGFTWGLGLLIFILLYKLGDSMASAITIPFYLDLGFSKTQIGAVVKLFGFWATIGGSLLGGLMMLRMGINKSLWIFGFLQAISTAGFAVLAQIGPSVTWLAGVIAFENLASGMGTSAYVAFMAAMTNKRFTATQYALLSSLMGVPRVLASAPTGWLAETIGWQGFFIFCAVIAAPGMLLLVKYAPWGGSRPLET